MSVSYSRQYFQLVELFSRIKRHGEKKTSRLHRSSSIDLSKGGTKKLSAVVDSVWEWVVASVAASPIQPVANFGLGLGSNNPPQFLIDGYKEALELVECNLYAPTSVRQLRWTEYSVNAEKFQGLPRFARTLSQIYSPLYGKTLDPDHEISVHSGGTEAILSTITAFVEPGDEVIVFEPAFDLYELHTRFVGGVLKGVPLHPPLYADTRISESDDWTFDLQELEDAISAKTRILILNTPHNPLGKVFSAQELFSIGGLCIKYGVIILSDEVYEHLHYTQTFARIATLSPELARHTVTIGSIGKAFNATGWRVGYAIGDRDLIKHVQNAHIIHSYTTAGPAQMAAALGLEKAEHNGFWEQNRQDMRRKIDNLSDIFSELGLPYVRPSGAHYILVNAGKIRFPDEYMFPRKILCKSRDWKLSWFLIQECGVATIPVSASFSNASTHVAENYLRFVACKSDAEIELAKVRLRGLKPFLQPLELRVLNASNGQ